MAAWADNVNTNFYGLDGSPVENREGTKFKSGRVVYRKINTTQKLTHTVNLWLNDSDKDSNNKTEFKRFLDWNETTNGSGTVPITLTDIETKTGTKDYYVTLGNWSGQKNKEISLTLEEV